MYRVAMKKGESWKVQVFARTLGAPVDPKIWIRAANGQKNLLEADDARLVDLGQPSARGTWYVKDQQDPVAVFKVPADGEYLIGIEDATGAGGPDHVYRVEIEPVRDTVYTHITMSDGYQMPRLTGLIVPQGNRWTLDVQLAQGIGNNYKGEIELEAVGLPKGVTMIAPRVPKGATRVPVQFVAAADAPPQAAQIEILARAVDAGGEAGLGIAAGLRAGQSRRRTAVALRLPGSVRAGGDGAGAVPREAGAAADSADARQRTAAEGARWSEQKGFDGRDRNSDGLAAAGSFEGADGDDSRRGRRRRRSRFRPTTRRRPARTRSR